MLYQDFQGKKLSALGFGAMRLPTLENGDIDEAKTAEMTAYALAQGVNYFDTAWPYHEGKSEVVMGKILNQYPRESWYLATKYPGHQISKKYDPAEVFEMQLQKCGVEYFDFYLLHNVNEGSLGTYLDERWGILDYFKEQKRLGRIKHLGFSCHGNTDMLEKFLNIAGRDMEFCQIQLNWLDWTLQGAKEKVALLNRWSIPIWVMEPVRGGKLCSLAEENEAKLKALRPEETIPGWGFRFLQGLPGVTVVLSGMSNLQQMRENIATYAQRKPLTENERQTLLDIADGMKNSVPCTGCKYCLEKCPMGLDIPMFLSAYNELKFGAGMNLSMRMEWLPEGQRPMDCLACGKCMTMCPQGIQIPEVLEKLAKELETYPKWSDVCKAREEAAEKLRNQK